jgi:hypothetical protein
VPASPPLKKSPISSKGETVDKCEALTGIVCCDHVKIRRFGSVPPIAYKVDRSQRGYYIVAEEGNLKILCDECFMIAVQLPLSLITSH